MRAGNILISIKENKFSASPLKKGKKIHKKNKKLHEDKSKDILNGKKNVKGKKETKTSPFQSELLTTMNNLQIKHKEVQKKEPPKDHQLLKSSKKSLSTKGTQNILKVSKGKNLKSVPKHLNATGKKAKNVKKVDDIKAKAFIDNSKDVVLKNLKIETKNSTKIHHDVPSFQELHDEGKKNFKEKNDKHFEKTNTRTPDFISGRAKDEKNVHLTSKILKAKGLNVESITTTDSKRKKITRFEAKKITSIDSGKGKITQLKVEGTNEELSIEKGKEVHPKIKKDFQKKILTQNVSVKNLDAKDKALDHSEKFKKSSPNQERESSFDSKNVSLNSSETAFKIEKATLPNSTSSLKTRTLENKEGDSKGHFDEVQVKITKGQNVFEHDKIKAVKNVKKFDNSSTKLKKSLNIYKDLPQVNRGIEVQHNFKSTLQKLSEERINPKGLSTQISRIITKALENQKPPLKIEIHLNPPQLGKVTINIVETNGKTSLVIDVEKTKTLELMKASIPIMNNQLSNLNFNLVNIQLNGQQLFEGNQERKQNGDHKNGENREKDGRKFSDEFNEFSEKEV